MDRQNNDHIYWSDERNEREDYDESTIWEELKDICKQTLQELVDAVRKDRKEIEQWDEDWGYWSM